MRIRNNIVLFTALTGMFSALFINFIVIKSFTMINIDFMGELDAIYFDYKDLPEDIASKVTDLMNSGNNKAFKKLIETSGNPVSLFYGFSGFMKSNRIAAVEYIKSGIIESPKKVTLFINGSKVQGTLGYAITYLLNTTPDWLSPQLNDEFIRLTDKLVLKAYTEGELSQNTQYKTEMLSLIQSKYPILAKALINDFVNSKSVNDMTLSEKREVSQLLGVIELKDTDAVLIPLLKEKDTFILKNTLSFISSNTSSAVKNQIDSMINVSGYSDDIKILLVDVYAKLFKAQSTAKLIKFMLANDSEKVLMKCISIFEEYGDDSHWAFLTRYLGAQYSTAINNRVLTAITLISWKENPDNVYSTLIYSIRRLHYTTVIEAINFYIKNNLATNQSIILTRLRELDNEEIKKTAIRYIKHFKEQTGADVLKKLAADENEAIRNEAKGALAELGISM